LESAFPLQDNTNTPDIAGKHRTSLNRRAATVGSPSGSHDARTD
jgi:hypothetical protein